MCLIPVLFASNFLVAPPTTRTSVSFHDRQNRAPELDPFRLRGLVNQSVGAVLGGGGVGDRSGGQHRSELVFDQPGSLQFSGCVTGDEDGAEPVPCPVREVVVGPKEHVPVGPDRVDEASPPAMNLLGEALPELGEHVVA
jgi:hypothetical protein